ncbi:hypothetical protein [Spirosoma panaciterrae]|uniref:hypothetical protein n=1 Tax=Spirosoma panaciterrae TaxID=496058 RepID=UPI0012F86036|nr:hypothetical protein [Spirosoma panaciterrae]
MKNYLMLAYELTGQKSRARELLAPTAGRNDKVSVRYTDGKVVKDVKYKKVEADIQVGKCVLV